MNFRKGKSQQTFRAITRPLGMCKTFFTTPPLPAPRSPISRKSSTVSSPILCFWLMNASSRRRWVASNSRPSRVRCNASIEVRLLEDNLVNCWPNNLQSGGLTHRKDSEVRHHWYRHSAVVFVAVVVAAAKQPWSPPSGAMSI